MFEPNWASPPGDTISRLAAAGNVSVHDLAERVGLEEDVFSGIMEGRIEIGDEIAAALSSELGASSQFWIQRYNQFLNDKARTLGSEATQALSTWGQSFPAKALRQLGWLPKGSRGQRLSKDILDFFGCDTIRDWNERYSSGIGQVAFRTSFAFETDEMATLAWLRIGEIQAESLALANFSANSFKKHLYDLKKFCALKRPELFFPKLQKACAEHGVGLVSSRAPIGCRASGATWSAAKGNPIILLSFRYLTEDHFWFTFFHETAHVILHGTDHISVDGSDPSPLGASAIEDEADAFARDALVPTDLRGEMLNAIPTRAHARRIARKAGVTPGIIVGQLQKAGTLQPHQFNDLKRRYKWGESTRLPVLSQPRKYT
ncbi:ImmA/IrrE family metallo-endopeptidase [Rhodovulum sulfidophilum]|uniref:ImmA/IrrE family metallo-endopeptidase n=1 Tax=Rhodovulum sulfidophilum TaxID=35806 RepID=UPI0019232A71|nr:ImmA/IrrE family metallo-endopeptidase [Rhodovulum sulfidophilum]MBL3576249.1 ImmA/IrrE family metallo-endopeptidase [Rhodovulum sulfidophilum]MCE8433520.1 ImmA/IrrE family metallo-endopeptidase [Rhodovulum sulfidophilum]MCF4119041.1 ImmA/IrrE family metallo-endopeptidase [Rhodovulum sulfidophilum]